MYFEIVKPTTNAEDTTIQINRFFVWCIIELFLPYTYIHIWSVLFENTCENRRNVSSLFSADTIFALLYYWRFYFFLRRSTDTPIWHTRITWWSFCGCECNPLRCIWTYILGTAAVPLPRHLIPFIMVLSSGSCTSWSARTYIQDLSWSNWPAVRIRNAREHTDKSSSIVYIMLVRKTKKNREYEKPRNKYLTTRDKVKLL